MPPYIIFAVCKKLVLVIPPLAPGSFPWPPRAIPGQGAWELDGGLSPASSRSSHVSILSEVSRVLTYIKPERYDYIKVSSKIDVCVLTEIECI